MTYFKCSGPNMRKISIQKTIELLGKKSIVFSGLLVLVLVVSSSVAIADTEVLENNEETVPSLAPVNPDFVVYQQDKIFSQSEFALDGNKTGFIPPTVDLSHLRSIPSVSGPFSSNYDLRTLNRVTSVKNQNNSGVCWAFATYGSLESYLMPEENWNFSENNMKNLLSSAYPEGFDRNANEGGNHLESTAYLVRWSGPVDENDDPYDPDSNLSPQDLSLQKHVQNVLFLPNRQGSLNNDGIKWAVQNYGAVYTSMYYNDTFYSPATASYYYNNTSLTNHAVAIVGWNDSFDKSKFSEAPPGDGAFIVRNSWGADWGENGYFYVSYYDSKIGCYNSVFTAESPDNYELIYQYDPFGWTSSLGYEVDNTTAWGANIFTAKSDELLKAVSFYTTDSGCNYEIYIYTDPVLGPINQTGPVFSENGSTSVAGYHTIPLDSDVRLTAGQNFSVVLNLTNIEYGYPIAIEEPLSGDDGDSSKATANSGESFISSSGEAWADIITVYPNTSVCIKAFTDLYVPVFPGYTSSPTDLDHDGLYEDINGNGGVDFDDVVAYYVNMDWIEENATVSLFDYNNNDNIDFDDVVILYNII